MRTTDTLQSWWLAGYYDDFNSARMVADEKNLPNYRTLDHTISHFGPILGGINTMNPRYVYSYIDRAQSGLRNEDDPVRDFSLTYAVDSDDRLQSNAGIHEWLTNDPFVGHEYEHRARLRVPSSLVANRYRVNGAAGDSYLRFVNGHDTTGHYYAPLGNMDPTYGASQQLSYESNYSDGDFIGGYAPIAQEDSAQWENTMVHTNFASVYTGEKKAPTNAPLTVTSPDAYLFEITSPSKQMFLVNSLVSSDQTFGTQRLLTYTGPLRLRGIGECFHIRLSAHEISGSLNTYRLRVGYKSTATYSETNDDFDDTTCLVELTFNPWTQGGIPTSLDASTTAAPDFRTYNENEIWCDVFIYFNAASSQWSVYFNDETTPYSTGSFGAVDLQTAKGWSIDAQWGAGGPFALDTLIDRAATFLPLNWKLDGTLPPITTKMGFESSRNSISSMTVEVLDDDNQYALSALVTASSATEWRMLAFRENESRPIWSGIVEQIAHKQSAQNKTLSTSITARDSAGILDRILPMWERGQGGTMSLSQHVSMDYTLEQRAATAESLDDVMVFGSKPLRTFFSGIGFAHYDTSDSGLPYYHNDGYRMNLHSGTAVQIYQNEDTYGPNYTEEWWEGRGSDSLCLSTIIAEQPEVNGVTGGKRSWFVEWDDPSLPTFGSNSNRVTISSYLDIQVSDTVTIEGTDWDGSYTVNALRAHKRANGLLMAEIEVNDVSASATLEMQFDVQTVRLLKTEGDYKYVRLTCSAAHGLGLGDTFILPAGCIDSSVSNHDTLKGVFLNVWDVPSTTSLVVRIPKTWETFYLYEGRPSSSVLVFTSNKVGRAYPLTEINSHSDTIEPVAKAHLYKGTSAPVDSNTRLARAQYRDLHARWVRDFARSPWFRAQFGIIKQEPLWRSGAGSHLQHPLSAQYIAAHGYGGHTSEGKANWTGLSSDIASNATTITFENPAMWFKFKQSAQEHAIIELLDNETNDHQWVIAEDIGTPTYNTALEFDETNEEFRQTGTPKLSLQEGDIVVHTGFSDDKLNGVFVVTADSFVAGGGSTDVIYKAVEVIGFEPAVDEFAYMQQRYQSGSAWNFGAARHFRDPDAIRAKRAATEVYESLTPLVGSTFEGTLYAGSCTASGVKGLRRSWPKANTIFSLRDVDESNGYKHMFVLWADMRNDGEANADGTERKNDFGLIIPTSENYSVTVAFADQLDAQGKPDVFTELKIGADIDMWSMDSQVEPFTGGRWCALNGASNDEPFTQYHNWDEKAGAFVLIDASRFFNLNTTATGGRVGYNSGGLVDFGDYVLAVKGFPFLVDSYWREATLSWRNNSHRTTTFAQHPNARYLANDHTTLSSAISVGDTTIYVDDNALFDSNGGYGAIIGRLGEDRSAEDQLWYFAWTGTGTDAARGDYLSGVYITNIGRVVDPATAEAVVASEVSAGGSGSRSDIVPVIVGVGDFTKVFVYNTTAAAFPLRLMVNVTGRVLSRESGTFYSDGKMRSLFALMTSDTWAGNTALPCMFDINTIPVTRLMTTTQTSHVSGDTDSFGSMEDGRGRSILSIAGGISEKDGNGLSGASKTFSWLMGRDNLLSVRPTYETGQSLDRNNLMVSDMTTQLASQVTNVRVFFNGNSQFADYPEPTLGQATRWRSLNYPNISSYDEALSLAKQEYAREQESRIDLKVRVLRRDNDANGMLTGARYGYIGDVFRRFYTTNGNALASWTNLWGGFPFSGVQFLHDKVTTTHDSVVGYISPKVAARIMPDGAYDPKPNGFYALTADSLFYGSGRGKIKTVASGSNLYAQFDAQNNGASYGPLIQLSAGYNDLYDGSAHISVYASASFISSGVAKEFPVEYEAAFDRTNAHHHYGTNSLHYAAQIVHIDRDMPKSSGAGNELRVGITIDSGTTADDCVFRLWLLDYTFDTAPAFGPACPTLSATLAGSSSTLVSGSGFYRLSVPSSYDSDERSIVVSVDAQYLRSIVRKTAGSVLNAHNIDGLSTYSSFNTQSAFPLGMRNQTKMGPRAHSRTAYYAPRIHVVDDIAYVPATVVSFNDDYVDMPTQDMVIGSVRWVQDGRDVETVDLNLQRSESHYAYTLAGALRTATRGRSGGPDSGARPELPPPAPQPRPSLPPVGGGGSSFPQPIYPSPGLGSGFDVGGGSRIGSNLFTSGAANTIKGRGSFSADSLGSSGQWGVIGAQKPSTALAANRDVDGVESSFSSTEGAAILTSDGISLAGITDPEAGAQGETNSYSTNIRVPSDVSEMASITVTGIVSLQDVSGGGNAVITTTVSCVETGASFSTNSTISGGSDRKQYVFIPFCLLNGATTPGNTIKVEITRSPGQGSDSAGYQTVVIHTLSVSLRRFSLPTNYAQSGRLSPY